MKKFMLFLILFIGTMVLVAQGGNEIPVPTDPTDIFTKFQFWVGAFGPLVGLTVYITQLVISLFKITGGGLKQILSWGLGAILVVILNLLNLGIAKDLQWYGVIAYAIAVVLAANRAFDVGLLESILKWFKFYKPKP